MSSISSEPCWHSRGYLPHLVVPGAIYVVTFRLADSLPAAARDREGPKFPALLDAGRGSCVLGIPAVADRLLQILLEHNGTRYRLHAWVIMPNHVHVLVEPLAGWSLSAILHRWKRVSAAEINRAMGKRGRLWQPESYDRVIRDERHFAQVVEYIHLNAPKAGLVERAEEYRWSSARLWREGSLPRYAAG